MSTREEKEGMVSELEIHSASLKDSGTYTCSATNTYGTANSQFNLIVQGKYLNDKPPVIISI